MHIAVNGCGHGELENIYGAIKHAEATQGITVDLLLCCGDFQVSDFDMHCSGPLKRLLLFPQPLSPGRRVHSAPSTPVNIFTFGTGTSTFYSNLFLVLFFSYLSSTPPVCRISQPIFGGR